jgi:hypothetical protein
VDDVLHNALDVAVTLSVVDRAELGSTLAMRVVALKK